MLLHERNMSSFYAEEYHQYFMSSRNINPFILMDYPIHIDTILMELSILYFKGLPIKISLK